MVGAKHSTGPERVGLALLCLAAAIAVVVYPTYPNYDSYYSLLWGRELLDLDTLSFEAYRAPTEHPLAILFGAVLALLGGWTDRLLVLITVATFVWLVWGVYRLAEHAFTKLVGLVAALLVVTRFDFPFLAARGYIDVPYMAIVVWAGVLEARAPRERPELILGLLALAGLMRPEGWVLAGLAFLWYAYDASWARRFRYAALAAIGPVLWAATDYAVTGDPLYSLNATSELAEELGRNREAGEIFPALYAFLIKLDKFPVLWAGIAGVVLSVWLTPRRVWMPLVLGVTGIATFLMVGLAGLSLIERYLIVASLVVMVFAAFTLAGWTILRPESRLRRPWMVGAAAVVIYGLVFSITSVNLRRLDNELTFRGDAHAALEQVLDSDAVRAGVRCGPVSVPNHRLIPEVRWILDLPDGQVIARSERTPARGVALLVTGRTAIFKQAYSAIADDPRIQLPPPGFERRATSRYYSAYVRC